MKATEELLEKVRTAAMRAYDHIDFQKIHAYMRLTNWRWALSASDVPTVEELQDAVYDLIGHGIDYFEHEGELEDYFFTASGGFEVCFSWEDPATICVTIRFSIEQQSGLVKIEKTN